MFGFRSSDDLRYRKRHSRLTRRGVSRRYRQAAGVDEAIVALRRLALVPARGGCGGNGGDINLHSARNFPMHIFCKLDQSNPVAAGEGKLTGLSDCLATKFVAQRKESQLPPSLTVQGLDWNPNGLFHPTVFTPLALSFWSACSTDPRGSPSARLISTELTRVRPKERTAWI
jgi:hypothetical protein